MAELSEPQKREIVEALACFSDAATSIANFRSEHGLELSHKQVGRYDPTRPCYETGDKWREIFHAKRKGYLGDFADVPVAHQGYRLQMLQKGVDAAVKAGDWGLAAELLKQAAQEVGGKLMNERHLKVQDSRQQRVADMSPEERRAAMAELIRRAMESAPARFASVQADEKNTVQ